MWEETENGSDNALCHSYYTSQLLSARRKLEVARIICQSKNTEPAVQPVCTPMSICICSHAFVLCSLFHFSWSLFIFKIHDNCLQFGEEDISLCVLLHLNSNPNFLLYFRPPEHEPRICFSQLFQSCVIQHSLSATYSEVRLMCF